MLQAHAAAKFNASLCGHAGQFSPCLGTADGVEVARHHAFHSGPCRGVGAWNAHLAEGVVLIDALARIECAQVVQDVGRAHHTDVEVVRLDHVLGHALNVLNGHLVQTLEVGLIVVFGQIVALNVQREARHCALVLQGAGKASRQERLGGGQFGAVHLFVANAVDLSQELHKGAVRDFGPNVCVRNEFCCDRVGRQGTTCAVREGLVFAQVLHQTTAESSTSKDGVHHLNRGSVWVSWRERHGLGDVDGALNGPLNGGEPDLVSCREFGGHDARVRNVSAVPVAEVGIGFGVGFVWCDVANDDQVCGVGAEVRLVVLHHVVARDVLQRGFCHDFAVGVERTVVGGSHDVAGDFSGRGSRVGQSRHRLLLHFVQFFLWEGGLENGVRHNAKEVACVLAQGACKKAFGVGAERCSEKLDILGDLGLGAGLGARRHHGTDDAGQACLVAFQKRRVVQGHVP